jgi:hypothetical protein
VLGLFDISNALADVMVRRNLAPPALLRAVLLEWAAHGRNASGDERAALTEILADAVGSLDVAPGPSRDEAASGVITLATARARHRITPATSGDPSTGGDAA